MADFGEREKIQEVISDIYKDADSAVEGACIEIWSRVKEIPAADVRPVVKAAWEQVEVRYEDELIDNPVQAVASMFCPNCQRYHNEVYFYGMPTERVNFCPNCGAMMGNLSKAEHDKEQREYEAAVEAAQYCEMYEPTYDPETGAM